MPGSGRVRTAPQRLVEADERLPATTVPPPTSGKQNSVERHAVSIADGQQPNKRKRPAQDDRRAEQLASARAAAQQAGLGHAYGMTLA